VSDQTDVVTVERQIPAAPEAIFELLVDPARHPEIDGSGSVVGPKGHAPRLTLGSSFTMSMKMGMPYSMTSTVIAYEPNRLVTWQTKGPGRKGWVGGRIWSYQLEPVEGGTRVRESWDISQESAVTKPMVRKAADKTRDNMAATLERIERIVTS
jgi:uncharacterized protein YndB with AHSA1/START domain